MSPAPHQKKLPSGYTVRKAEDSRKWYVVEQSTGRLVVRGQLNPKIAVERAMQSLQ